MSPPSPGRRRHDQLEPFIPPRTLARPNSIPLAIEQDVLTGHQAWCLYVSHFLSMWNSRTYEYGAAAFPGNLLPSSINGIAETVCVLASSSYLGRWVDRASTRLRPLLFTIFANRISLVACCILWILLFSTTQDVARKTLFAAILLLGMMEKASRMTNILSMERDWVPVLANAEDKNYGLTHLNTTMKRIDIVCKFTAPLLISSILTQIQPSSAAALIALVSAVSVVLEATMVLRVWKENSRIRAAKDRKQHDDDGVEMESAGTSLPRMDVNVPRTRRIGDVLATKCQSALNHTQDLVWANVEGIRYYFSTTVWLPSICVAVLHGSVLAWSGTLITWLLNAHFTLAEVTIAKSVGSLFEIGSTLVFPWAVRRLFVTSQLPSSSGTYQMVERHDPEDEGDEQLQDHNAPSPTELSKRSDMLFENVGLHAAVIRVAEYSLTALSVCLIPTIFALVSLNSNINKLPATADTPSPLVTSTAALIAAIAFWSFLSLSFLGRWTYDLAETQLTQMLVPPAHRAAFGGTEQAIVSTVSLVHWVMAAIWHRQDDFVLLAGLSTMAVGGATLAFANWSRRTPSGMSSGNRSSGQWRRN